MPCVMAGKGTEGARSGSALDLYGLTPEFFGFFVFILGGVVRGPR